MAEYRMRYKHDDHDMTFGDFNSDSEAFRWWESMTSKETKNKPRDWVLERSDGYGWTEVASHDAGGAGDA